MLQLSSSSSSSKSGGPAAGRGRASARREGKHRAPAVAAQSRGRRRRLRAWRRRRAPAERRARAAQGGRAGERLWAVSVYRLVRLAATGMEPPVRSSGRHSRIRSEHWLAIEEGSGTPATSGDESEEADAARAARARVASASPGDTGARSGGGLVGAPEEHRLSRTSLGDGSVAVTVSVASGSETAPAGLEREQREATTLSDRKKEFWIIVCILTPAVITTTVLLIVFWAEGHGCGAALRVWIVVEDVRLAVSVFMSWVLQRGVQRSAQRIATLERVGRTLSLFSLCWFILGHVWIFEQLRCEEDMPTLFGLAAALLILQYAIMFLPLILVIVLAPIVCLFLPCIILEPRLLLFNRSPVKGASKREIARLPTLPFSQRSFRDKAFDDQCSICIMDFEEGETVRVLRCRHVFHRDCVDNWLTLNKSCPVVSIAYCSLDERSGGRKKSPMLTSLPCLLCSPRVSSHRIASHRIGLLCRAVPSADRRVRQATE